jgi:membrane protein implicated in regulation of membrane protease activity
MLLKRSVEVLVVAALVALILVAWPAVAEAQEAGTAATQGDKAPSAKGGAAHTTHTAHAVVVVEPGDSLWSISEERLGPDATARRIAKHTERLWALNRERIGSGDPNLILAGQQLLAPPVGERPSSSRTGSRSAEGEATTRRAQERATDDNKAGQALVQAPDKRAPEQASGQAREQVRGQAPQRVSLPEAADARPVPAARAPISEPISGPTSYDGSSSPTLAMALVAWALLTLVAALVAWVSLTVVAIFALRALRARGQGSKRKTRKRGASLAALGTNYARFDPLWGSLMGPEESPWGPPSASEAREGNGLDHLGLLATAKARRARVRRGHTGRVALAARRQRGRPRLASHVRAYDPQVFRAMRTRRRNR